MWRETEGLSAVERRFYISIHSLRVEGDSPPYVCRWCAPISIHSLRVEGDVDAERCVRDDTDFNPLPPCGGRPLGAPLFPNVSYFNPLPPCGGRPPFRSRVTLLLLFQSTPSVWRETVAFSFVVFSPQFQSTPSVWRETP